MEDHAGNAAGDEDYLFNEYAIDDTLDPLARLLKYHTSDFALQRLVLIRELTDTAMFAGYQETVAKLVPLLSVFVSDSEPAVRQTFVQQLPTLASFVVQNGGDSGYHELLDQFLPFAVELLVDKNVEVGNSALQSFVKLAELVKDAHVEAHLLQVLISLAHDERTEDYRVVAAQLFNDLSPKFGEQLCAEHVIREVKLLADDMSFSVRKTVGASIGTLSATLGPAKVVEFIVPMFQGLCRDDIWGVRKACAESIVSLASAVTPEARVQILIPLFKSLSEDASRWVRVAAYQNLGQFIHTLRKEDVSTSFLKIFTDMAFQSDGGDSDFAEYCAFAFPAVTQTLGRERWRELDDAFATLLKDVQWKVRKSLAFSLHEMAAILGQDASDRTLSQAFELFLRDLDEVKLGVLSNVPKFFACLSPQVRERFVPQLCALPGESDNWRLRNIIAQKIGGVAVLLSTKMIKSHVIDVIMRLLDDSVVEVRSSTYHSAAQVLEHLSTAADGGDVFQDFLRTIKGFASKPNFQQRQIFVYIFQQLVEIKSPLVDQLLETFCLLGEDRISNIRFVVARVASASLNNSSWKTNEKVLTLVKRLSEDKEKDTANAAVAKVPPISDVPHAAKYLWY